MPDITAESIPAYDIPFFPFDEAWSCQDWMQWHRKLKEKYGRQVANKKFLEAWQKLGFWEWNQSFCKYNSEFTGYFEEQNLDPHNFVSRTVEGGKRTAENVAKSAENLSAAFTGNTVLKVLGVLGLAGGIYYSLFK